MTREANGLGPRRVLLRDASGVLMVVAFLAFIGAQLSTAPADGGGDASPVNVVAGSGVPFPTGTLNLWTATPVSSPAPSGTQRVVISKSTPPPWCADPQCSHFVTPSPSPTASPKPSAKPSATPIPSPSSSPTATPT
jgi:hypothetical protein